MNCIGNSNLSASSILLWVCEIYKLYGICTERNPVERLPKNEFFKISLKPAWHNFSKVTMVTGNHVLAVTNSCLVGLRPTQLKENTPGTGKLSNYLGLVRPWSTEESLPPPLQWTSIASQQHSQNPDPQGRTALASPQSHFSLQPIETITCGQNAENTWSWDAQPSGYICNTISILKVQRTSQKIERSYEPMSQKMCREIVSPSNDTEATIMIISAIWLPK